MDFRRIEVFVSVIEEGNFSQAAKALFLSQPTISAHIEKLEQELGVILFERGSKQTTLTEAGRRFYPFAIDLLELKEKGVASIKQFQDEMAGEVKIFSSSTPGIYLFPNLIQPFLKENPGVSIFLGIKNSLEAVQGILEYQAHLALVGTLFPKSSLEYTSLGKDQLVAILPQKGFVELQEEISLQDLFALPFIIRTEGSGTRRTFDLTLEGIGENPENLKVILTMDSLEGVIKAVAAGLGVTVASSYCKQEGVRQLKIKELDLKRDFYLVYHRYRVLSPFVEQLVKFIIQKGGEKTGGLSYP